jgi:hypothetical protein
VQYEFKELQSWPLDDRERALHIFTEFTIFSPDGSRIVFQYRTDVEMKQDTPRHIDLLKMGPSWIYWGTKWKSEKRNIYSVEKSW